MPAVGLLLALVSCYGTLALIAMLGAFGVALKINDRLWGAIITVLAAVSWLALVRNAKSHRRIGPVLLGLVGLSAIGWTMTIHYAFALEVVGFGMLFGGVLWDRSYCARRKRRQAKKQHCSWRRGERFAKRIVQHE